MATGVTVESVLGKISEDHLECSICSNRFREPKVLDCFHNFCLQCLQELRRHQKPSSTRLICPLCRGETILEGTDIAGLPSNFTLRALVEEVTMQEKLFEGEREKIKCQSCDEKNPAISICMDCDHFICHECRRAHERMAVMKSHKTYTLAQLRSGEVSYKSKLREYVPKCGQHPDQNLNVYCETCKQMICTTCSVLDHVNPKHSLTGLSQALEKHKRQVVELLSKSEKSKTDLSIAMNETDKSKKNLDSMFADTKRKISQKADREVAKIREEEQKLIREAERIYKDRVKAYETAYASNSKEVAQAENMLDEVSQLMTQASCYEILELEKKLLHNLSELVAKRPERVPDRLSFMDFDDKGEGLLGRLTVDQPEAQVKESQTPVAFSLRKWELKTTIHDFGIPQSSRRVLSSMDVASFSNNQIVVAYESNLITFSLPKSRPESLPVPNILPIKGLTEPRCVAVNKDDQLIILDKHTVKIFNKNHLLHQFMPRKSSKEKPRCLAVDDSNLIAVGYKEEISLHNPDGSLIRTLPAPMMGYYLTIYKQRLIYSGFLSKRLLCIDYNGTRVFSADIHGDFADEYLFPTVVCCDSDGSIYVAVDGWLYGDLLHYNPDGKFIGYAVRGFGSPHGITLTSGGDLVMASWNSVQVYHCVTSD